MANPDLDVDSASVKKFIEVLVEGMGEVARPWLAHHLALGNASSRIFDERAPTVLRLHRRGRQHRQRASFRCLPSPALVGVAASPFANRRSAFQIALEMTTPSWTTS
jgi:hypothetical protein